MKKLALIGSKDFAIQITENAILTNEYEIVGYYDDIAEVGKIVYQDLTIIGKVEQAFSDYSKGVFDCIFIGVGYTRFDIREFYYNKVKGKIPLANIINPSCRIKTDVVLGEGIYIGWNSIIGERSVIKDNVFIHGCTTIAHDNIIDNHTYFSGRCDTAGFCHIGKRCFFGIRSCIADHITICDDVWIGLGAIVAKDIKKNGKYMSAAAKLFKIE